MNFNVSTLATATDFTEKEILNLLIDQGQVCYYEYNRNHVLISPDGTISELNCKSWRCPRHRGNWKFRWWLTISREVAVRPINKLITLTLSERCSPRQLRRSREYLCEYIRQLYGEFSYLYVLEFTVSSRLPHLHMIARAKYIKQSILSDIWDLSCREAGIKSSPVVYIEKPRNQGAGATYALKYAFNGDEKNQSIPDTWKGRKVGYSRNFFAKPRIEYWNDYIREKYGEREVEKFEVMTYQKENIRDIFNEWNVSRETLEKPS